MQNGVRVTSTRCVGSQNDKVTPAREGFSQAQNQSLGVLLLSSWLFTFNGILPPNVIGNTQLQQISVMGFKNLPSQVNLFA